MRPLTPIQEQATEIGKAVDAVIYENVIKNPHHLSNSRRWVERKIIEAVLEKMNGEEAKQLLEAFKTL
jgi:hypothetical protein